MTPERPSPSLVLRVNELFHDMEGAAYANVHPEIFEAETHRWDSLLAKHVAPMPRPLRCVDVGCGTGFVSERLLRHLRSGDSLVCADISDTMLAICRDAFSGNDRGVSVDTLKLRDESIGLPDASAEVVTLNSVLHHVPDARRFLGELARILAPGGLLMIGHEPSARFWKSAFLRKQYAVLHGLAPKRIAARALKATGLYGRAVPHARDAFLDELNARLLKEGIIDAPLTRTDLSRLVDVHSPTAGGVRLDEGFDPYALLQDLPLEAVHIETYNHLSKMSDVPWLKPYAALMKLLRPRDGAAFFLVARKHFPTLPA